MPLQAFITLFRYAEIAATTASALASILLLVLVSDSAEGVSYDDAPGELIEQKCLRQSLRVIYCKVVYSTHSRSLLS